MKPPGCFISLLALVQEVKIAFIIVFIEQVPMNIMRLKHDDGIHENGAWYYLDHSISEQTRKSKLGFSYLMALLMAANKPSLAFYKWWIIKPLRSLQAFYFSHNTITAKITIDYPVRAFKPKSFCAHFIWYVIYT